MQQIHSLTLLETDTPVALENLRSHFKVTSIQNRVSRLNLSSKKIEETNLKKRPVHFSYLCFLSSFFICTLKRKCNVYFSPVHWNVISQYSKHAALFRLHLINSLRNMYLYRSTNEMVV